MEFVRLIHWIDHSAAHALLAVRKSPAWFFVASVGALGLGLTLLLFVSMIEQTSQSRAQRPHSSAIAASGHQHLGNSSEWASQDRWRVAHLFISHRPPRKPRDIHLDSRLFSAEQKPVAEVWRSANPGEERRYRDKRELDVRLELSRPRQAEQDRRLVAGVVMDGQQPPEPRIRQRDSRLRVQASWDFGPECRRDDFLTMPARRFIPIPEPDPETQPFPVRRDWPDLSFGMEFLRHFSTGSHFPPDSQLIKVSSRTAFPNDDQILSDRSDPWRRFHRSSAFEREEQQEIGRHSTDSLLARYVPHPEVTDEFDGSLPTTTEINLRLVWSTPQEESHGQYKQARLLVENEGQDSLHRLEVLDLISDSQTVVVMDPEGGVEELDDPETGANLRIFHRERRSLQPGGSDEFRLKWLPESGHPVIHRSRVIAQAAVYAATEVTRPEESIVERSEPPVEKHPALACDVAYVDRAYVGDKVDFEITVRNTGDTPLHTVQVRIDIPEQLSHPDGDTVVFNAGDLDVRGQNRTVVKLSARKVGQAVNSLSLTSAEEVAVHGATQLVVVERQAGQPPVLQPIPSSKKSEGACCCQRAPIAQPSR